MSGTWASGWIAGDIVTAAEFKKGAGALADNLLGGSAANIDFTGIVGGYAHLMIVGQVRCDNAATQLVVVRFNNDATANYDSEVVTGTAAVAAAGETLGATGISVGTAPGTGATAGYFNGFTALIPNYAGTTSNKVLASLNMSKTSNASGAQSAQFNIGGWRTTATAITRLTFLPAAGNFIAGTRITVYGMGA